MIQKTLAGEKMLEEINSLNIDSDENNEKTDIMDAMLVEEICEKIEKDSRRYKRYLGNDSKAVFL